MHRDSAYRKFYVTACHDSILFHPAPMHECVGASGDTMKGGKQTYNALHPRKSYFNVYDNTALVKLGL